MYLTLYQTGNYYSVQSESLSRQQIKVGSKGSFSLDRVENIVGNEENAGCQHFLLFPQCFQKASFPGSLNTGLFGKGLVLSISFQSMDIIVKITIYYGRSECMSLAEIFKTMHLNSCIIVWFPLGL